MSKTQLRQRTDAIEREILHLLEARAQFYRHNLIRKPELCQEVLDDVAALAPSIAEKLKRKVPEGSPLQNLISDFQDRVTWYSEDTHHHVKGVVKLTAMCAEHLVKNDMLTAEQGADLCIATIIHDFGKLHMPTELLHAPLMTEEQRILMRPHVDYSSEMARLVVPHMYNVRLVVDTHHERQDGTGYPHGLTEAQLPPIARILPVTDTFATIVQGRGYKPGKTPKEAFDKIDKLVIKHHFDGLLVSAMHEPMAKFASEIHPSQSHVAKITGAQKSFHAPGRQGAEK